MEARTHAGAPGESIVYPSLGNILWTGPTYDVPKQWCPTFCKRPSRLVRGCRCWSPSLAGEPLILVCPHIWVADSQGRPSFTVCSRFQCADAGAGAPGEPSFLVAQKPALGYSRGQHAGSRLLVLGRCIAI
eukprot:scaffold223815_cov18-Tisochrysis_lutea.AAC.1